MPPRRFAAIALLALFVPTAFSQQPRTWDEPDLRLERGLVTFNVTVVDPQNRRVTGLDRENFTVFDDKVLQEIAFFGDADEAVTIGIVYDTSGSMKGLLNGALQSLNRFNETRILDDEYFLVTFDVRARLTHDFTHDATALAGTLILAEAKGRTALYDAVYLGVLKAQEGHNTRKALLVISDGMDNSSRYTSTEVKRLLEESDVAIYTLFMSEPGRFGVSGPSLWNLGERVYTPTSEEDLVDICQQIARDLHQQYSIGYYPTSHARDGKWHDLRIKIASPPGLPKLTAVAKAGYRAPSR